MLRWFDSKEADASDVPGPDWMRVIPFALMHLACLGLFWVGWDSRAVAVAALLYFVRMFAITGFYHRYFCHRAFKTNRVFQFLFALLGSAAVQRGPLWWAAHHRHHHRHSDTAADLHSPRTHGFLWSHMGWFTSRQAFATNYGEVADLARYPELRFLDRFDTLVPVALAGALFAAGGWPMLLWGFFVSTVVLFHATCCINSLAHRVGRKRFETNDDSRNSFLLALLTLGEGWHNNHHHFSSSARQGFRWWEIDITYYGLCVLARLGVIRDLRPLPERLRRG
ncbi:MAG: acyl-CoA desaturase [Planctomycetaceae bacterium]